MQKLKTSFTLIELVLVIAILGILISLLQPSVSRVLKQAEKVNCLNNLRQVAKLTEFYRDDSEGAFYQLWHQNPWNRGWHAWGWILSESEYLDTETEEDILYCPSGTKERDTWWLKSRTYGVNQVGHYKNSVSGVVVSERNEDGSDSNYNYIDRAENPSEYMFIVDTKTSNNLATGKAMITNYDAGWNARIWQIHDPGLGALALFGDGHASFNSPEVFHELFGSRLNFAYGEEGW